MSFQLAFCRLAFSLGGIDVLAAAQYPRGG
jgi:hypothetical protein